MFILLLSEFVDKIVLKIAEGAGYFTYFYLKYEMIKEQLCKTFCTRIEREIYYQSQMFSLFYIQSAHSHYQSRTLFSDNRFTERASRQLQIIRHFNNRGTTHVKFMENQTLLMIFNLSVQSPNVNCRESGGFRINCNVFEPKKNICLWKFPNPRTMELQCVER